MHEKMEAVVLLAKCGESHKAYGIRAESSMANHWRLTWAFPVKESSAKREGYDKTSISGNIDFTNEYPGCPHCGGHQLTVCSCGHIGCTIVRRGKYTCEWCGSEGELGGYNGAAIKAGLDF